MYIDLSQVDFEWDSDKADANLEKHGVDFADAVAVFDDARSVTVPDEHPGEERFVTVGMDVLGRIVVVVYTWRDERIRIISARKANRLERRDYEA